ncbi:MAG: hypothetical protein EOP76_04935 [Variovorax sp.]|nr:MAG: hypothetical protein EOP76_04935 [Variovorax sp.]
MARSTQGKQPMPSIRLDVPLEAQEYDYSCWHSAAYMVWLYWQQNGAGAGPMNTIASSYAESQSQGISAAKFIVLAQKVGLMAVPPRKTYTTRATSTTTTRTAASRWPIPCPGSTPSAPSCPPRSWPRIRRPTELAPAQPMTSGHSVWKNWPSGLSMRS